MFQGKTAEQWRALAQGPQLTEQTFFDLDDPDAFMSAWTSGKQAQFCELAAQLAENNGLWQFNGLFDLKGQLIPGAVWIKPRGRYARTWLIPQGDGEKPRFFNPSVAKFGSMRLRNDKVKGFYVGVVRAAGTIGAAGNKLKLHFYVYQVKDAPVEIVDSGQLLINYQDRE